MLRQQIIHKGVFGPWRRGWGMLAAACLTFALALACATAAGAQTVQPRIVGGSSASIADYPWQGALVYSTAQYPGFDAHERQFCGGSLITASIVVTAAHCVQDTDPDCNSGGGSNCHPSDPGGDGTKKIDPNDIDVVLGRTTLSNSSSGTEHLVQDVSFHSEYNRNTLQNDVGYLVLDTPSAQGTIDIAGPDEGAVWAPGVVVEITGWGSTSSGGNTVDSLRKASVPIVADSTCGSSSVNGNDFDPQTMVCAGYLEGGIDTCQGDSGGPLQSPLQGGGYRLVGITSWGFGCAEPNAPGVYTRIAAQELRDDVVAKALALEAAYSLPHENVVGSGGQPKNGDTDPPETTITSGPLGPTNDSTPTFTFSSDESGSSFECRFDAASFGGCSGPGASHTPATALSEGAHTFEVRAIDAASNTDQTPATRGFTVDTQPPTDPTLSSPSHTTSVPSNDNTVEVAWPAIGQPGGASDAGGSGVDGFSYVWNTSPTTTPDTNKDAEESATGTTSPTLANGSSHYFHLRTRDNAGNWTSTEHLGPFVIDAQEGSSPAPSPPTPSPPPAPAPLVPLPDSAAPVATLAASPKQKAGAAITVEASCDEPCAVIATGVVVAKTSRGGAAAISAKKRKFKLRGARVELPAFGSATLKLLPRGKKARRKKSARALRKLVKGGSKAKAKITVTTADRVGNATIERVVVGLTR